MANNSKKKIEVAIDGNDGRGKTKVAFDWSDVTGRRVLRWPPETVYVKLAGPDGTTRYDYGSFMGARSDDGPIPPAAERPLSRTEVVALRMAYFIERQAKQAQIDITSGRLTEAQAGRVATRLFRMGRTYLGDRTKKTAAWQHLVVAIEEVCERPPYRHSEASKAERVAAGKKPYAVEGEQELLMDDARQVIFNYSLWFPEEAMRLDGAKLMTAIVKWKANRGWWVAFRALCKDIDIELANDVDRQWRAFKSKNRTKIKALKDSEPHRTLEVLGVCES